MGNSLQGKSSKSSYGEDLERSSGGIVEIKEPQTSTTDSGGATVEKKWKTKDTQGARTSSSRVEIENNTDKQLVLREKVRAANGIVRYRIEAGKFIVVHVGPQTTYYRLLVYAIKDNEVEDTGLTIDSDNLSDASKIVISKDQAGKYTMSFE